MTTHKKKAKKRNRPPEDSGIGCFIWGFGCCGGWGLWVLGIEEDDEDEDCTGLHAGSRADFGGSGGSTETAPTGGWPGGFSTTFLGGRTGAADLIGDSSCLSALSGMFKVLLINKYYYILFYSFIGQSF